MADNESTAIRPDVAPAENEVVIVKRRVGAFSFTELEMILRAQGIENLILTGVTTSRVVLPQSDKLLIWITALSL